MAKKDFSKVNTNPLYDAIQEAATPMPGQTFLEGTDPAAAQAVYETQLANATIVNPEDAPEGVLKDFKKMKRNQPRAGKVPLYTYLEPAAMAYIDTMAGLQGVSRQTFVNNLLLDAAGKDPIYKQAQELRKEARKGK